MALQDLDHKEVLSFYKENDLFRKTKTRKLYNISFKYDFQTYNNEYQEDFVQKVFMKDPELYVSDLLIEYLNQTNLNIIQAELNKIVQTYTNIAHDTHIKKLYSHFDDMRISTAESSAVQEEVVKV